jgi:prophage regulatory protein
MNQNKLLRFKEVKQLIGLSRSSIWRLEKSGNFPRRRRLSSLAVGWLSSEVESWIDSRKSVGGTKHD